MPTHLPVPTSHRGGVRPGAGRKSDAQKALALRVLAKDLNDEKIRDAQADVLMAIVKQRTKLVDQLIHDALHGEDKVRMQAQKLVFDLLMRGLPPAPLSDDETKPAYLRVFEDMREVFTEVVDGTVREVSPVLAAPVREGVERAEGTTDTSAT